MESLEDRKSLRPLSPSDHRAYQISRWAKLANPTPSTWKTMKARGRLATVRELASSQVVGASCRDAWRTFDLRDEAGQGTRSLVCSQVCHSRNSLPPDHDQEHNDHR